MHIANKTLPNPSLFKFFFTELRETLIEERANPTEDTKLASAKWEMTLKV